MFGDMMGKLQEMKQQVETAKKRLDDKIIEGEAADGAIKVSVTGNRKVKNISIAPSLLEDAEELEDMLVIALNRALTLADGVNEQEMAGAAGGLMGGMGL